MAVKDTVSCSSVTFGSSFLTRLTKPDRFLKITNSVSINTGIFDKLHRDLIDFKKAFHQIENIPGSCRFWFLGVLYSLQKEVLQWHLYITNESSWLLLATLIQLIESKCWRKKFSCTEPFDCGCEYQHRYHYIMS